jgi:hypothetical protein
LSDDCAVANGAACPPQGVSKDCEKDDRRNDTLKGEEVLDLDLSVYLQNWNVWRKIILWYTGYIKMAAGAGSRAGIQSFLLSRYLGLREYGWEYFENLAKLL